MLKDYWAFFRQSWPLLLFGLLTVFWGNFGQSFFISWFGASFQTDLGLTATEYGSTYSAATLASGLLILALGGAIDRMPLFRFVTLAALGLMTAGLVLWQASNLIMLVFGLFLLRFCGQGLLPHSAMIVMAREFDRNRGKAISIAACGLPLGEMVLPALAVLLLGLLGWQHTWLVIALLVPLIYLPLAWALTRQVHPPGQQEPETEEGTQAGTRITLLKDYRFWLALPLLLSVPFIVTGVFIHQGFILPELGWSPVLFASAFIFYGVGHWSVSMVSGALVDKYTAVRLLPFFSLPLVGAMLMPLLWEGHWVAFGFMALLGSSVGLSGPIVNALWAEVYGTRHLGSLRSLITSVVVLSTAASPVLFGLLIDRGGSVQTLFGLLTTYGLISGVLALMAYRPSRTKETWLTGQ